MGTEVIEEDADERALYRSLLVCILANAISWCGRTPKNIMKYSSEVIHVMALVLTSWSRWVL
jgi:hypothetical protein